MAIGKGGSSMPPQLSLPSLSRSCQSLFAEMTKRQHYHGFRNEVLLKVVYLLFHGGI